MLNSFDDDGRSTVAGSLRRTFALPATADNISVVGGADELTISPVAGGVPLMGTSTVKSKYQRVSLSDLTAKWGNPRVPAKLYSDFATFATDFHTYNSIVITQDDFDLTFPLDLSGADDGSELTLTAKSTSVRFSGSSTARVFVSPSARLRFSVKASAKAANAPIYLGYVRSTVMPTPSIFDVTIGGVKATVSFVLWVAGIYTVVATLPSALTDGETEIKVVSSIPFGTGTMRQSGGIEPTLTNGLDFPILTIYEIVQDGIVDSMLGFINPYQNNDAIWIEADAFQKNRMPIDISSLFANINVLEITDGLFDNQTIVGGWRAFQGSRVNTIRAGAFANATLSGNWSFAFRQAQVVQVEEGAFPNSSTVANFYGMFYNCASLTDVSADVVRHAGKTCLDMSGLFYGCRQLTTIPDGLLDGCSVVTTLSSAFSSAGFTSIPDGLLDDCVGLTVASSIFNSSPITAIPDELFKYNVLLTDLSNCFTATSIAAVPETLFSTLTKLTTLSYAFMNCGSLATVPDTMLRNCVALSDLSFCFYAARNVNPFPTGLLKGLVNLRNAQSAFELCGTTYRFTAAVPFTADIMADLTNLRNAARTFLGCPFNSVESGAFDSLTNVTTMGYFFGGPSWSPSGAPITTVPADLFSKCASLTEIAGMFASTAMTDIPANLFTNLPKKASVKSLGGLFWGCTNLTTVPAGLFDGFTAVTDTSEMFYGASQLADLPDGLLLAMSSSLTTVDKMLGKTGIVKLRASYIGQCTKLTSLTGLCTDCLSLTEMESGALGKSTLVTNANDVFYNCSSLVTVPDEPLLLSPTVSYAQNMFAGCASLKTIFASWFSVPDILLRIDAMFKRSGVTKVPTGLFSGKKQVGVLINIFSECRSLLLVEAGWLTIPTQSSAMDLSYAFESVAGDIAFEAGSMPLNSSSVITNMLGIAPLSSGTGGYVGFAGSINRLDNVFTVPSGQAPRQYANLLASRNNTPNSGITGTAKALLTSLGLTQSDMATIFRGNPNITWE